MKNSLRNANTSNPKRPQNLLAMSLAVVMVFFTGGPAVSLTLPWVIRFSQKHYGYGWETLIEVFWFLIVILVIYALAKSLIATLVKLLGFSLWTRLF